MRVVSPGTPEEKPRAERTPSVLTKSPGPAPSKELGPEVGHEPKTLSKKSRSQPQIATHQEGQRSPKIERPEAGHRGHGRSSSRRTAGNSAPPVQLNFVETNVRALPRARHSSYNTKIFWIIGACLTITSIMLAVSLGTSGGRSTFYVAPALAGLTFVFTLVLGLGLRREVQEARRYELQILHTQVNLDADGRRAPEVIVTDLRARDPAPAAMVEVKKSIAERPVMEVCAWILFGLWTTCITLLVVYLILRATGTIDRRRTTTGLLGFEVACTILQMGVMEKIAKYCRDERRWNSY